MFKQYSIQWSHNLLSLCGGTKGGGDEYFPVK